MLENSGSGSSQAHGAAENEGRALAEQVHVSKVGLKVCLGIWTKVSHAVSAWLVEDTADLVSKCSTGQDDRTPYEVWEGNLAGGIQSGEKLESGGGDCECEGGGGSGGGQLLSEGCEHPGGGAEHKRSDGDQAASVTLDPGRRCARIWLENSRRPRAFPRRRKPHPPLDSVQGRLARARLLPGMLRVSRNPPRELAPGSFGGVQAEDAACHRGLEGRPDPRCRR